MSGETLSGGTVSVPVKPDTKGFGQKLSDGIMGESSGLAGMGKKLGGLLLGGLAAVGITAGVGEFIKKGIEEYSAADALNAQFAAGIKSTNNAANLTVKSMDDLAASISGYSGQAYDSIGKTEQVLQTFTNIRNVGPNKIFDEATTAAANMAAKLGGDASASAIQLGKALQDPVQGVTALRRVGVQLTASQTSQIKAMVASGNVMGAQKIILGELTREFGGAAKAAGETLPGEINRSKVAFGELTKAVMGGVMPFVTPIIGGVANAMNALTPRIEAAGEAFRDKLDPFVEKVKGGFSDLVAGFTMTAAGAKDVGAPLTGMVAIGQSLRTAFDAFKPAFQAVGQAFKQLGPVFAPLIPQVVQLASAFSPVSLIFHALLPVLPSLITLVAGLVKSIGTQFASVLKAILPVITSVTRLLTGDLAGVFKELVPIITQIAKVLGQLLGSAFKELTPIIVMVAGFLKQLLPIVQPLIQAVMSLVAAVLPLIAPLLQLIGPILKPLISLFAELLKPILSLVSTLLTALMPIIMVLVNALAAILPPVIKALMPIIQAVANIFLDILGPAIKAVTQILNGIVTFLTGVFTGNWRKAWSGIVQIFSGIWNGIIGIAKGIINGIIDAINGIIGGINSVGGAVGIHIGLIPHLAKGATILPTPGGTLVRVAEAGQPESVVDTGGVNALIQAATKLAESAMHPKESKGEGPTDLSDSTIQRLVKALAAIVRTDSRRGPAVGF